MERLKGETTIAGEKEEDNQIVEPKLSGESQIFE
jgi:hypothetical protein